MTLRDLYKKSHWQVAGPTFYQLHLLFDKHFDEQVELVDSIAERIQLLGGISIAMAHDVAEMTRIERPPRGREAVAVIQKESPDLIFLDIQMPELDGFGVLEAVTAEPAPVIVFVTAHDQYALRAFEVNAVDYLLKPFTRERLQSALERARDQREHRRAGSPQSRARAQASL